MTLETFNILFALSLSIIHLKISKLYIIYGNEIESFEHNYEIVLNYINLTLLSIERLNNHNGIIKEKL